ncbi:MAG: 4-(cytidine 5'-diphospho)-2-C-methyl-D-erythritol kinase [Actinomycetota bacterium]
MGEAPGSPITEPAPAKLNPFLRVLGARADGYHDIETVVQPITLADGVQARPAAELSLAVAGDRAGAVPGGHDNLVMAAARALREACDTEAGATILLVKRVPVSAGLGGGSADAAAALRALNDLWGCGLDRASLVGVAARVGSDVPALLLGEPVVARGRGERVEALEAARTWWVLLVPEFGVGAAEAYRWWDEDPDGEAPDAGPFLRALARGDLETLSALLWNDLEGPVSRRRPEVAEAKQTLLRAGSLGAIMSGSGPAVAGLARDGSHAEEIAAAVSGLAVSAITRR